MYAIEEKYPHSPYRSGAFDFYFGAADICVLDIETTGLSPYQSSFILGGLLAFTEDGAVLKQFFAEDLSEERLILSAYLEEAAKYDMAITYNGKHFDLPFLTARSKKLGLCAPDLPYNFDLYLVLSRHSPLRKFLPNLKQKTVEDFMGLWHSRTDKISGGESAMLYQEYLFAAKKSEAVEKIMLHNSDDVLQLSRLLPILGKADLHSAMYSLGFPVVTSSSNVSLIVDKIEIDANFLIINGKQRGGSLDFISYGGFDDFVKVEFHKNDKAFRIQFRIFRKAELTLLDLLKLPVDLCAKMSIYPNFGDGYLVLQNGNRINYTEINCFIKLFLEKTIEQNFGG